MASVSELASYRAELVAARSAILVGGQSYAVKGRSLTRADLKYINDEIIRVDALIESSTQSRGRAFQADIGGAFR